MSEEDTFAETEEYQTKVISYMLHTPQFAQVAHEALKPDFLSNRALQWYFTTIGQAASTNPLTSVLLKEELKKAAKAKLIKEAELDKYVEVFGNIQKPPVPAEEQHINETLTRFIRKQATKRAILDSFDLIQNEDWDEVVDRVTEATRQGVDVLSFGHNYFNDFTTRLANRLNKEEERRLSTGIPVLDEVLYGGIKNKQLGLIAGGTGRGKSIFLEWLAKIAVVLGKQVVYYTLELSEEDISERFDSLFCHIKPQELKAYNTQVFNEMHKYASKFGNNLIIKEYPADECTINTIKAHYRQLASIGVTPDLVIVDYLDLMKPHRNYSDTYQELDAITKALHGFAKSFNTRVWTATQLNRSGMVAETPDESSIAGAVAKLFTVDISIFLAATKEEREDEIMRLYIAKNRNGPAARTLKISTDYAHMTFYRGTVEAPKLSPPETKEDDSTAPPISLDKPVDNVSSGGTVTGDDFVLD